MFWVGVRMQQVAIACASYELKMAMNMCKTTAITAAFHLHVNTATASAPLFTQVNVSNKTSTEPAEIDHLHPSGAADATLCCRRGPVAAPTVCEAEAEIDGRDGAQFDVVLYQIQCRKLRLARDDALGTLPPCLLTEESVLLRAKTRDKQIPGV